MTSPMEYRNELLDEWVGGPVVLSVLQPPDWGEEDEDVSANVEEMVADPTYVRTQILHAVRIAYELTRYDRLGLTLRTLEPPPRHLRTSEPPPRRTFFVPWGAVLRIEEGFEEHARFITD